MFNFIKTAAKDLAYFLMSALLERVFALLFALLIYMLLLG